MDLVTSIAGSRYTRAMTTMTVKRTIRAAPEAVFQAVADLENLPNVVPDVVRIEFQSDQKSGVGTRFRETRRMKSKENHTDLEITECEENRRIRFVADSHGTVWDTVFQVTPAGQATDLTLTMEARAHKLLPKLMNPLFKGLMTKGLAKHVDAVQAYCER